MAEETMEIQKNVSEKILEVLVVEDNLTNQKLLVLMLEHLGCRVDAVFNGKEALKILSSNSYNLIFMDVQMPEMDGFEATTLIRHSDTIKCNKNVPILAITAHVSSEYKKRCFDSGMSDYLAKPVRINELSRVLAKWSNATHSSPV